MEYVHSQYYLMGKSPTNGRFPWLCLLEGILLGICGSILYFTYVFIRATISYHTVDGRNPAPVGR